MLGRCWWVPCARGKQNGRAGQGSHSPTTMAVKISQQEMLFDFPQIAHLVCKWNNDTLTWMFDNVVACCGKFSRNEFWHVLARLRQISLHSCLLHICWEKRWVQPSKLPVLKALVHKLKSKAQVSINYNKLIILFQFHGAKWNKNGIREQRIWIDNQLYTSSTAQGGGGSFKDRKL